MRSNVCCAEYVQGHASAGCRYSSVSSALVRSTTVHGARQAWPWMACGSGGKLRGNWTRRPRKWKAASRMRFEKGTIGKLDVPPAEPLATASANAGRSHSIVDPLRSEA